MSEAWYAVYTKFHHEKSSCSVLTGRNVQVFLPVYRAVHRWKDRNQMVILPLFPCYLFVRIALERKLEILRAPGVCWLVENGGHACPVSDSEIETIQRVCSVGTRIQPHPFLKQGTLVRVRTGPLSGTEGILVQTKNQYRVVLTVELLQKSVAVEVDQWNIEVLATSTGSRIRSSVVSRRSA